MARQIVLLVCAVLCLMRILPVMAQNPDLELLAQQGVEAYMQHDFSRAAAVWEQIVIAGVRERALYYNLARAYEYMGKFGKSRLYDLRAYSGPYAEGDSGTYFRSDGQTLEAYPISIEALDRGWARQGLDTRHPVIWLKHTVNDLARSALWSPLGLVFWWALCTTVIVVIRWRIGRWALVIFLVGLVLWGGVSGLKVALDATLTEAVSIESTPIYTGPGHDYVTLATWPEGYDLYILETRGEWVRVMRADGASGWVEQRLIALVSEKPDEI